MIKGLQDGGMIASCKHFPGLGDISIDPHIGLPKNLHDKKRLEEVELYPFCKAIEAGVLSIQTDHVLMPALDDTNPSSLSPAIVQKLLKEQLGFKGLVLSGALRMQALKSFASAEDIVIKAFVAGSDMLLMPQDTKCAVNAIKQALEADTISMQDINERVLKILEAKERFVCNQKYPLKSPTKEELKHFRVHGITADMLQMIKKLEAILEKCIICYFGNPYGLHFFDAFPTCIMCYENDDTAEQACRKRLPLSSKGDNHASKRSTNCSL